MLVKKIVLEKANRLHQLPPELLTFVPSEQRGRLLRRGDTIDLATFRWPILFKDFEPTTAASLQPTDERRLGELKEALAAWLATQHGTHILADKEIFVGGSISCLLHALCLAFIDHGDLAFVPDLGLPAYRRAVVSAGGEPVTYSISAKSGWQPEFDRITTRLGKVARLLFLNSPHNPTGAELSQQEMENLVWNAGRENLLVVNDAAYQAIPDRKPVSLLAVSGGKKVGVEVYSFAYQFGLPWLPFGFVAGNREVIAALEQASRLCSTALPAGYADLIFEAIRKYPAPTLRDTRRSFGRAADTSEKFVELLGLNKTGFRTIPFLWLQTESRRQSVVLARQLFRKYRLLVVPGTDFGEGGEGYVRVSLTAGEHAFAEAADRLKKRRLALKQKDTDA